MKKPVIGDTGKLLSLINLNRRSFSGNPMKKSRVWFLNRRSADNADWMEGDSNYPFRSPIESILEHINTL